MNISRTIPLHEGMNIDLRGEFFNILNHGEVAVENTMTCDDALSPRGMASFASSISSPPSLSNSFLLATNWYKTVFSNTSETASDQLVPFSMIFLHCNLSNSSAGAFPGGENFAFPQGHDVTGSQFQDDLSWTKGKHTLSVGWDMRRNDITDHSLQEFTSSPEVRQTNGSFQQGHADYWAENFPTRLTQPVALYGMGWYIQDE
jgi:hypothetical protein